MFLWFGAREFGKNWRIVFDNELLWIIYFVTTKFRNCKTLTQPKSCKFSISLNSMDFAIYVWSKWSIRSKVTHSDKKLPIWSKMPIRSKILISVNNRQFGQKWPILTKMAYLVKNCRFGKKRQFGRKYLFSSKIANWSKMANIHRYPFRPYMTSLAKPPWIVLPVVRNSGSKLGDSLRVRSLGPYLDQTKNNRLRPPS